MPDSKITALTSISTSTDPANDPLVIVDVSDTSMAATGTTKKVTLNQLLGASGTATLASATISGDLTVDTNTLKVDSANNRVGIGTATPATPLNIGTAVSRHFLANGQTTGSSYGEITTTGADVIYGAVDAAAGLFTNAIANASFFGSGNATSLQLVTNSTSRYEISSTGVATWSNVGGVAGTAMTLNATGLGLGGSVLAKISAYLTSTATYNSSAAGDDTDFQISRVNNSTTSGQSSTIALNSSSDNGARVARVYLACVQESNGSYASAFTVKTRNSAGTNSERLRIDSSGNVGIGVTPSAAWTSNGNLQVGIHAAIYTNSSLGATDLAYNSIRTGSDTYQYLFATSLAASRLQQRDGSFRFFTAPAGTSPNAITFTERLRLKETGQLRFVPLAADPAGAEAGDVYYNSTSNKLKCYNGTTWNDLF